MHGNGNNIKASDIKTLRMLNKENKLDEKTVTAYLLELKKSKIKEYKSFKYQPKRRFGKL